MVSKNHSKTSQQHTAELDTTDTQSEPEPDSKSEKRTSIRLPLEGHTFDSVENYEESILKGRGQKPCYVNDLQRYRPSKRLLHPRNVTIQSANFMRDHGGIPQNMSIEKFVLIQDLLDADRQSDDRVQTVSSPSPAPPTAEEIFPGELRPDRRLHWGLKGSNIESQGSHYTKIDFQRALYNDGVDLAAIQACKNNTQLASLWQKRRDDYHADEADITTLREVTTSAAAVRNTGDTQAVIVYTNAFANDSDILATIEATDPVSKDYRPTSMATTYAGQHSTTGTRYPPRTTSPQLTSISLRSEKQKVEITENKGSLVNQKSTFGNSKKKPEQNDPERERRIALAARVGRFPLSLPGNNNGRPLTMERKTEKTKERSKFVPLWSTYKAKYNRKMAAQILTDYNVLPPNIESLTNEGVFRRFVIERDLIHDQNIPLQVIWTNEYLEAYVANQEARGLISAATFTPTFAPISGSQMHPPNDDLENIGSASDTLSRKRLKRRDSSYEELPRVKTPDFPRVEGWTAQSGSTLVNGDTTHSEVGVDLSEFMDHQQADEGNLLVAQNQEIDNTETQEHDERWESLLREQSIPYDSATYMQPLEFDHQNPFEGLHRVSHPETSDLVSSSTLNDNVEHRSEQRPSCQIHTKGEDSLTIDPRLLEFM